MSKQIILITGGSGQIGRPLTARLLQNGHEVRWLTRSAGKSSEVREFEWDIHAGTIDRAALEGVDTIIHLAGASINGKRWTPEVKKELRFSRVASAELIHKAVSEMDSRPKHFVGGSAIGYYGYDSGGVWKKEESRFGDDFLATLTKEWEKASESFADLGLNVSIMRTGIVLTNSGGALVEMSRPVKWGLGSALGSGEQYVSWIHIDDVVNAFAFVTENSVPGTFNLNAPDPATNRDLMKTIASVLGKPFFMPKVPKFAVKLLVGEMASAVLGSIRASSEKLIDAGYNFEFEELEPSLNDLFKKNK